MGLLKNLFTGEDLKVTSLYMDNFHIDITAFGKEALILTLEIVLMKHKPTHWCDHPTKGLVLFWHKPEYLEYLEWTPETEAQKCLPPPSILIHPFPSVIKTAEKLATIVEDWLEHIKYGRQPDIDGSCSKGFRIYNEQWSYIHGCSDYSFIAIKPEWAIHHK